MYAVICIKRNAKQQITYNSGFLYFKDQHSMIVFRREVNYDTYEVDMKQAHPPETQGKGLWCPYCQTWNTWVRLDGYKKCPICFMTDNEFYVKNYNDLWPKGVRL